MTPRRQSTASDRGTIDRSWPIRSSPSPALLAPAFAQVAGATSVDPVVRPSDHADAQANGALALAKQLGRNPREVADDGRRRRPTWPASRTLEVAGPGFINVTFGDAFLRRPDSQASRPTSASACSAPATHARRRRRLLGAERRQGDARRPPAHHRHRRLRSCACYDVPRPHGHPREPHRRLGHAVRHAHRAPRRRGRDAGADSCRSATSTRFYQQAPGQVRQRRRVQGARPATGSSSCRAATPRRSRLWRLLVDESHTLLQRACTASSASC